MGPPGGRLTRPRSGAASSARRTVGRVPRISAGLLLYRWSLGDGPADDEASAHRSRGVSEPRRVDPAAARRREGRVEVLCGHMGGPLWARKDERAWSFPKGELDDGEDELAAARREFVEELGLPAPDGRPRRLGEYRYSSGKLVVLFAVEGDVAVDEIRGGTFAMEWPPRSGRRQEFPEIDRAAWFDLPTASAKLVAGQVPALDDLSRLLEPVP